MKMFTKIFKNNGIVYTHKKDIANKFSMFFTEIGPKYQDNYSHLLTNLTNDIQIKYVTIISNFKLLMKKLVFVLFLFF